MSKRMNLLSPLPYKKIKYQQGEENDCIFVCSDGNVPGGANVLTYQSRFLDMAILKEKEKNKGTDAPIKLDFEKYSTETVKVSSKINIDAVFKPLDQHLVDGYCIFVHFQDSPHSFANSLFSHIFGRGPLCNARIV